MTDEGDLTTAPPLLNRIDRLLDRLSTPLPATERACGWTEASRAAFAAYYAGLRQALMTSPTPGADSYPSIARELDYWGIAGGEFAAEALALAAGLRRPASG